MGKRYFSGIIKGIFSFFNKLRLFLINIAFWGLILAAAVFIFKGDMAPDINKNTVLKIHLNGHITEQYSGGYRAEIESIVSGQGEILLRDIKEIIDFASSDERITSIFLDLSGFKGGGFAKLQEIGKSLEKFKNSGKKIICYAEVLDNSSYYLASSADKIVLDQFGELRLRGFSTYRNYYKKGLDKYSIKMNVFKAGNFKSAVDPYLLESMSDYDRRAVSAFYDRVMTLYAEEVASNRNISSKKLLDYIINYDFYLKNSGGDSAETALISGLVDITGDYETAYSMIDEIDEVDWSDYLKTAVKGRRLSEDRIAVVTASGIIMDGDFEPGKIGSETFKRIFESVYDDESIKAVVFRIDSGGGSASASEKIRRAVVRLKEKGKPVVVSMSSAAASGGYWISADSDSIISYPSTITGSIGVFAVLPDFSEFLEKYPGITVDGYSSLDSPESYRPDKTLDEREKEVLQLGVDNTYRRFINIVAGGRNLSPEEVEKLAGGRIWSGIDAADNRLIDKTGYFDDAVKEAATLAGINDYSLVFLDPVEDWKTAAARELSAFIDMIKTSHLFSAFSFLPYRAGMDNSFYSYLELLESGKMYTWTDIETFTVF